MKAEEILELVDSYGAWPAPDSYAPVRAAIAEVSAERRQLAKSCVVVINRDPFAGEVWCTVCGVRQLYESSVPLKHREGCLVGKVESEG